ncbi:MAG: trehalose-phosphatase [Myxococcales bacterium]
MKHLLARRHRPFLERLANGRLLLGLDFDGTLAPIVPRPDRVRMRASTRRLLAAVAERYPTAVISGRARDDVAKYVAGVTLPLVVGNHGMEWPEPTKSAERVVQRVAGWRERLAGLLRGAPGIEIEDKRYSLSVHFRRARDADEALAAIMGAIGTLPGCRGQPGKLVVNVLPEKSADKGTALRLAMRRLRCDTALFVGDDTTDEDAFALEPTGAVHGCRVGASRRSHASWYVPSQEDVDDLLNALLVLRAPQRAERRNP